MWSQWGDDEKHKPGQDRKMNALPDGGPDALRAFSSRVLGDECGCITGRDLQEPEEQPVPHNGWKRSRHLELVVPREQDCIDKDLHGHKALTDNERRS